MEAEFTIKVEQDWLPVHGNAMSSGDPAFDKECEDEIIKRLDDGDVWAWAAVTVVASCEGFTGEAHLGACSYKDEEEFKQDDYYADLCKDALADLKANIEDTRARLARIEAKSAVPATCGECEFWSPNEYCRHEDMPRSSSGLLLVVLSGPPTALCPKRQKISP